MPRKLRILTWHVHGNYLFNLTQVPHDFLVLADEARSPGYAGRSGTLPWGDNVIELPVSELPDAEFDCVLYQSRAHWEHEREHLLSAAQQRIPSIYLEHDPPQEHPTSTRHFVEDRNTLVVHVTPFNRLMWDMGDTPATVVEHGVMLPRPATYTGELARGIAIVNNLARRGRRLGLDVYSRVREQVPLDLVGMDSQRVGGLGEVENTELAAFAARYRFFFNPIRWTSLGLAVVEAMMVGMPVIGLATTEMVTVIQNGESGYVDTRVDRLVAHMQRLIDDPQEARRLGLNARRYAQERFGIERFVKDWMQVFKAVTS
ncbi:MAG TPA: glycosyltransferase family 4 protein [Burkholderiales bacterium]|nr:glycosyltransferase family 4 protein [Burkholderiales bacterium]